MSSHARLGPSSAHRWMSCPASIRLCADLPEQTTGSAAAAGTVMHTAFERSLLGQGTLTSDEIEALAELDVGESKATKIVDQAVTAARKLLLRYDISEFLTEQRVDPGELMERDDFWGTADLIGANEATNTLLIADLKTGRGRVDPQYNEQMLSYGVGSLSLIDFEPQRVVLAIIQPPLLGDSAAIWEADAVTLREFMVFAATKAALTDDPNEQPTPSGPACQWCPAKQICPAHKSN